jgi:hypothetical protein
MTTQTTITNDKAKNQGFLFLGGATLALFVVVPALLVAGMKTDDHGTRQILGLVALLPAAVGLILSIFGVLILSNKIKPLKGA